MIHRSLVTAAFAVAVAAAPAAAGVSGPFDPSVSRLAVPVVALPVAGAPSYAAGPGPLTSTLQSAPRLESIRYRPRRRHRDRDEDRWTERSRSSGYAQFHGGVFDPEDAGANGALFGMRIGGSMEDKAQVGVALDWSHRSDRNAEVVRTEPLPGGGTVERRVELARSSFDLVPLLAFIQVTPAGSDAGPYFGIGGGYEALFVNAEDFVSGADYEATFDGWGWQAWGGFAFPMTRDVRLNIEVFANGGDLDREVDDEINGYTVREIVNVDGGGARFGLSWAF